VLVLKSLDPAALTRVIERAVADLERGLGKLGVRLADGTTGAIVQAADGDARRALNLLEAAVAVHCRGPEPGTPLPPETVREAAGQRLLLYDRDREEHHNAISAFIKSLRASDPDAALYYLARMLAGGEDPLFIARRLVILASEDVGNADPAALGLATSTHLAVERIGLPEGRIPLAQATSYLACAPKSNAAYTALERAQQAVDETGSPPIPMHLRNAPTGLMKQLGYGRDYRYPHDEANAFVPDENLPSVLAGRRFYHPTRRGAEAEIAAQLEKLREKRGREQAQGREEEEEDG
jgi:putative ATPase